MTQSPLRIGTAGWSVPVRYAAELPKGDSQLARYAQALNAVEINSSFHRPHRRDTYVRWADSTPTGFRFSVKMPRAITHFARLKNCSAMLDRFVGEVTGLGEKLGVLLVQLPPKLAFDAEVAGAFFRELRARIDVPVALEPRHAGWFAPGLDAWLAEREIARVAGRPRSGRRRERSWRMAWACLLPAARRAAHLLLALRRRGVGRAQAASRGKPGAGRRCLVHLR